MSIALIITRGYGNGTLSGDIAKIVTRGYGSITGVTGTVGLSLSTRSIDFALPERGIDLTVSLDRDIDFTPKGPP